MLDTTASVVGARRGATPDTPKVATMVNDVGIQCMPNTSDSCTHVIFSDITLFSSVSNNNNNSCLFYSDHSCLGISGRFTQ